VTQLDRRGLATRFRQGALTSLMNPKAYLFMLAVFPQFLRPEFGPVWRQALVMLLMIWLMQLTVYGGLALAAARSRDALTGSPGATRFVGRAAGVLLVAIAAVTLWRGWGTM
jgi:threonine/homoserine/homoserine lactone efflux protein